MYRLVDENLVTRGREEPNPLFLPGSDGSGRVNSGLAVTSQHVTTGKKEAPLISGELSGKPWRGEPQAVLGSAVS